MNKTFENKVTTKGAAKLTLESGDLEFPVIVGTENEHAIDVSKLRAKTGYITWDEAYMNTGATTSAITFLDGEAGILRYRGYPVEQLAANCDFIEVSYLLLYGELPTNSQLEDFREKLRRHTMLHEDMRLFYDGFPRDAHPMAICSSVIGALSTFYQDSLSVTDPEQVNRSVLRLMAKLPTIAAYAYKKSIGQPFVYPRNDLTYCENFLRMMFAVPTEPFEADPDFVEALNLLMSRTAARRPCGWLARRMRTCLHRLRPASVPFGDRYTAGPTKLALPCCSASLPMAAT
jgi:citrate synthase